MHIHRFILAGFVVGSLVGSAARVVAEEPPRQPPRGIEVPAQVKADLEKGTAELGREIEELRRTLAKKPTLLESLPDVQIYYNAVHYALVDDIFYKTNDFANAYKLLREGSERVKALRSGQVPWNAATGLVVRGYVSKIDGSVQPYGLVVPKSYKAGDTHLRRLDFWYHGRNDKLSELSFVTERENSFGEFTPEDTIVLHPYGRYCNANKLAGEVDSFEALEDVRKHYAIDENRILVRGFSMGGAATWHMATHYAGLWAAAAPGAGFVDTAIFQNIFTKEPKPTWYEQEMWHLYNAMDYAANLNNCPVVAYSGEIDKQKQAADLMSQAMAAEGMKLEHIIGPNTAHKYEPKAKEEVAKRVDALAAKGRNLLPKTVRFTTWTLRYNQQDWVVVDGLERHWNRARVNADILEGNQIKVETTNVSAFTLTMPIGLCPDTLSLHPKVIIDEQELKAPLVAPNRSWTAHFRKKGDKWTVIKPGRLNGEVKRHGLQGPIDDAFMDSFIMVRPTEKPLNEKVGAWAGREMDYAVEQWHLQFRGKARVKDDSAISDEDIASNNLILWGDPQSNRLLGKMLKHLPVRWNAEGVSIEGKRYAADGYAPILIFPNPLNPKHYVVLNSGFTFPKVAHISNALQVPELPDYAVVSLDVPAYARVPAGVEEAGFFDEHWSLKSKKQ
ncbi:prolyl oligopeptidase family serine peptidase [Pedosphaera parvula]|uniref:Peptidase S9 prolyl oligopeptidase catalytic domain-containing protein n=1 Tax=Pedosphaera parvula (strain Ellin514) TaxID=320771 RepID=B9XLZ1_PEDPL|nr:prolyl oligopeptidase family serine peptidase [Pedosphaera parvula]EEF59119.1 conserved hypothetical protein [Pedosphaera parvula Ellin514]